MKNFDTRVYSISDFLEWRRNQVLDLSPAFQRRSVWTRAAKSFLMDTVIRGKPMPKILITQELKDQKNVRTVVDGQQRLRTIIGFVAGDFTMLKAHNPLYHGKKFDELPEEVKSDIMKYEIGVDVLFDISLSELLDIFARINAYSVILNTQEKLNAKYLGVFKTYAYELGHKFASYFVSGEILTDKKVSRMAEAQLSSDLLVALSSGIQTVKNIESIYKKYEDSDGVPLELEKARDTFFKTMSMLSVIYPPEEIRNTNWSRQHLFYTLFTCVAHAISPIPAYSPKSKTSDDFDAPRPVLNMESVGKWRAALDEISARYDLYTADDAPTPPKEFLEFIDFSRRRTTDTEARVERTKFVLKALAQ